MSKADTIFIEMCKDIMSNGTSSAGEEVRAKWSDGTPAHTIKRFGVVNRYDLEEEFPVAVARSYADAPEIDGNVFVEDIDKNLIKAGDLLEVEITDADEYDLFAKLIRVKSA